MIKLKKLGNQWINMYVELPEKLYYTIGEVAKAFNVNTSLIRFWEKEFEVIKPKKNKKGNRLFTPKDISNLKLIYHLVKEKGYTLEGAKTALKTEPEKTHTQFEVISRLEKIRAELLKIKKELDLVDET
ncbi:HTH-type transcriptional repressor BluR [Flavobacteriaceae bacterium UJ101]|nr:HTH-type transcriptional repressor BluR [Flavobacteriaceae bacterium UJ101]